MSPGVAGRPGQAGATVSGSQGDKMLCGCSFCPPVSPRPKARCRPYSCLWWGWSQAAQSSAVAAAHGLSCPGLESSGVHSSALTSKVVAAYTEPSSLGNPHCLEPWQQLFAAAALGPARRSLPFWHSCFGRDARSLAPEPGYVLWVCAFPWPAAPKPLCVGVISTCSLYCPPCGSEGSFGAPLTCVSVWRGISLLAEEGSCRNDTFSLEPYNKIE